LEKKTSTIRKPGRAAGVFGERTVQLLKMQDSLYWSIILWSRNRSIDGKKVNVGDIYDESLTWFFGRKARTHYEAYLAVPLRDAQKRSLWIDSRLLERSGKIAERDGVPRNRVLYTALVLFVKRFGPLATEGEIGYLRKIKSQAGQQGRPIGSRKKPQKVPTSV
jgi:hypothetical protein